VPLDRFAAILAEHRSGAGTVLVGLEPAPNGAVDLHLRPLSSEDLAEELAGWRAPAAWAAVGLVAPAVVSRPGQPPSLADAAVLVARETAAVTVAVAGEGERPPWVSPSDVAAGRVADLCLRALDLPTPACSQPPLVAWALAWLDRLMEHCVARPAGAPALTWADVAAAHPLVADLPPHRRAPLDLVLFASSPLARAPWNALRAAAASGALPVWPVSAALATWMDDGSFGRHLLGRHPLADDLFEALDDLLPAALRAEWWPVVEAWGLRHPGSPNPARSWGEERP
jgi:hypothetical protein